MLLYPLYISPDLTFDSSLTLLELEVQLQSMSLHKDSAAPDDTPAEPSPTSSEESNKSVSQDAPFLNELQLVNEPNVSLAAIIKGVAATPLTNFEKKAALINVEMDKFGMGRYQICIWFL